MHNALSTIHRLNELTTNSRCACHVRDLIATHRANRPYGLLLVYDVKLQVYSNCLIFFLIKYILLPKKVVGTMWIKC